MQILEHKTLPIVCWGDIKCKRLKNFALIVCFLHVHSPPTSCSFEYALKRIQGKPTWNSNPCTWSGKHGSNSLFFLSLQSHSPAGMCHVSLRTCSDSPLPFLLPIDFDILSFPRPLLLHSSWLAVVLLILSITNALTRDSGLKWKKKKQTLDKAHKCQASHEHFYMQHLFCHQETLISPSYIQAAYSLNDGLLF